MQRKRACGPRFVQGPHQTGRSRFQVVRCGLPAPRCRSHRCYPRAVLLLRGIVVGMLLGILVGVGCHVPNPCADGSCACSGGDWCDLDCPVNGCDAQCGSVGKCTGSCPDDCTFHCEDHSGCEVDCDAGCTMVCERAPSCEVECGDGCDFTCRDASACVGSLGPDSVARCEMFGTCDITCAGACTLECGQGGCNLTCAEGAAVDCGDGRLVCAPQTC